MVHKFMKKWDILRIFEKTICVLVAHTSNPSYLGG
jgi:hypothetical protein